MKLLAKFSVLLLFASFFLSSTASAQGVNDFVITEFNAEYSLTNEDPQGLLTVSETISVDFSGQNQGILRAIPSEYEGNDLNLKVLSTQRDGEVEPHITYGENGNTVLRIGEAGVFITGEHTYVIEYQVENVIRFFDGYDEFFWDVNGDQWLQPFESVKTLISSPATLASERQPECFTGVFGSTERSCSVTVQSYGTEVTTTETLAAGETLTVLQAYEKGYFTPPPFWEKYRDLLIAAPIVVLQLLTLRSAYKKWQKYGKDYTQRAAAPFYGRPEKVSVMLAGYVANNRLSTKDISAGIIDLAVRGYLKVIETKDGRKTKHTLELVKPGDNKLTSDELYLLQKLFPSQTIGKQFVIEDKKHKLSSTMSSLTKKLETAANSKGFYEISPSSAGKHIGKQIGLLLLLLIVSFFMISVATALPLIIGIITFVGVLILAGLMTKRSRDGVILKEHVDGLKLYLSKAEKDRLEMHDAVAAPLSTRGRPPTYDRKFFEKLLPFAIAAGVEKSWAKAFSDIYTQEPDWYSGTSRNLTAAALASSLGDTVKATSQTFTSPSSSGSSGFSGGSAGGGGGGGGGGGW